MLAALTEWDDTTSMHGTCKSVVTRARRLSGTSPRAPRASGLAWEMPLDGERPRVVRGASMSDPVVESVAASFRTAQETLPFDDTRDVEAAARGLLAEPSRPHVLDDAGRVVWDTTGYGFLDGPAPGTVHPSLWRQSGL